jgi:hypothetical protein
MSVVRTTGTASVPQLKTRRSKVRIFDLIEVTGEYDPETTRYYSPGNLATEEESRHFYATPDVWRDIRDGEEEVTVVWDPSERPDYRMRLRAQRILRFGEPQP